MKDLTPVPLEGVRGLQIRAASELDAPWRAIADFRDILMDDHVATDVDAIRLVVDEALPRRRAALQRMQKRSLVA